MKDVFGDFFPLSDARFDDMIDQSIIVLDTNVLLDLYRYSPSTSEHFLELLNEVSEQLWMPYQVGWEFLRARTGVRVGLTKDHSDRIDLLTKTQAALEQTARRSRVRDQPEEKRFMTALRRYIKDLESSREEIRRVSSSPHDELLETIAELFDGKTQAKPEQEWRDDHEKKGAARYKQQTPPGYKDANKDSNSFGDYFVWAQCIEKAKEEARPMVIVTGDLKSDWWQFSDKKRIGPSHELLVEFNEETGQRVHIFDTLQFFQHLALRRERADATELQETENEIAAVQSEGEQQARLVRDTATLAQEAIGALNMQELGALDHRQLSEFRQWLARQNNTLRPLENPWASIGLSPETEQLLRATIRTSLGDVTRRVRSNPFLTSQETSTDGIASEDDATGTSQDG